MAGSIARGYEEIAQLLLDKGEEVNAQGGYLGNSLQAAAHGGHGKVVQLLPKLSSGLSLSPSKIFDCPRGDLPQKPRS